MKASSKPVTRMLGTVALAAVCLLANPLATQARDHDDDNDGNNRQNNGNSKHRNNNNQGNQGFYAPFVPGFILSVANSIAGRANNIVRRDNSYYEPRTEVRYYNNDNARSNSMAASIQIALARNGYYNGPIDGSLGPMSRRAIANYQADRGLQITGNPNSSLLNSLGL